MTSIAQRPQRPATKNLRSIGAWLCLPLMLAVASASPARAAVKDEAGFFSATAIQKANSEIAEIQRRFRKNLLIETVRTVPDDKVDRVKQMDRSARDSFFHKWANERARADGVNGVYVLICKSPGHVQVEAGADTKKRAFTPQNERALSNLLITAFREKKYDRGLEDAVSYVQRSMANNLAGHTRSAGPIVGPTGHAGPNRNAPITGGSMSWIVWLILIVVGVWICFALLRGISRGMGAGGRPPGPGGPGYGGYGYGGGGYGGGGGGFMSSVLGGLFGAAAGNWLYDSFFRGGSTHSFSDYNAGTFNEGSTTGGSDVGQDYTGAGGDFDDSVQAERDDSGAGGDFGGDDFGGGDFGGGDFGGGDFGGGDFGGGAGGDF